MISISRSKALLFYFIVSLFLFFEMGVQVSPSVMAAQLMTQLNITTFGIGLMSGFYFYTYTIMQIPAGMLFDRFNPRMVITIAILICSIGTYVFSYADSILMGSIARLLMGFGSAFAFVSVLVVTADLFPAKYFATLTGITQMLAALGAMTGQLPISILVSHIGWRHTMLVLSFCGLSLSLIVFLILRYEKNIGLKNIYFDINKSDRKEGEGVFTILKNGRTWIVAIYACLLWAPMSGFASLWGVPFLEKVDNISPNTAAFLCSLMWIGLAIASPLLGYYATFIGNKIKGLYVSALIGAIAFAALLALHMPIYVVGLLIFLSGAACSGQALSFAIVKDCNSKINIGSAIAINNMAVVISGAIFQPLIGKLIELFSSEKNIQFQSALSFKKAFVVIFLAYLFAFIMARFGLKNKC